MQLLDDHDRQGHHVTKSTYCDCVGPEEMGLFTTDKQGKCTAPSNDMGPLQDGSGASLLRTLTTSMS